MLIGRLMREAIREAATMIRNTPCEHKIGMCRCPHERFWFYQEPKQSWKPWLMGLLASADTREAAFTMEASLIFYFEHDGLNIRNNYNWTVSKDYGGEGPKHEDQAHLEHFVYIALKPLPPRTIEERVAAESARLVASGQAAILAELEARNPFRILGEVMDQMDHEMLELQARNQEIDREIDRDLLELQRRERELQGSDGDSP